MIALQHPSCVLLHGDALALMRAVVPDKSIDLVCTDPPYGEHTHAKLGTENRGDGRKQREKLAFSPLSHDQVTELAAELIRVAKGWILVFTDDRSVSWWGRGFELAGGKWVRTGHWVKTNPMPLMRGDRPAVGCESIVIGHAVGKNMTWTGGGRAALWRGPRDQDNLHPNQKPLWLMQELLGLFGVVGGSVLDPFLGSGSTAMPCFTDHRIEGLSTLDHQCKHCAKRAVDALENRPPLPFGMSILGIESDLPTLEKAKARIQGVLT